MWNEKSIHLAMLTAVTVAALFLLGDLAELARHLQRDADSMAANVNTLLVTGNDTMAKAREASEQAILASTAIAQAAVEQRAYWNKTSLETYKTMAALRLAIVRTNESLNDTIAPRMSGSLDASIDLQRAATERLNRTMDDLRPAIANLVESSAAASAAMQAAGRDLSDPAIAETLRHVDGAAGHVDDTSGDIAAFVHRETTPVRGTWNVIKSFLREFAGPSAQVATAIK